jgi:ATP-dependent DNA ligase
MDGGLAFLGAADVQGSRSAKLDLRPLKLARLLGPKDEVQLCAFDVLAMDGDDLRDLPLSMRKANLARLLVRRPAEFFSAISSREKSGLTCFARRANSA